MRASSDAKTIRPDCDDDLAGWAVGTGIGFETVETIIEPMLQEDSKAYVINLDLVKGIETIAT
jgi:hypothetical protein